MLYYLDTVIVVYAVEGKPADQARALSHIESLEMAGHRFIVSGLTHTESLVPTFGSGASLRLTEFFGFFHGANVRTINLTTAMHTRAAAIRGGYNYPTSTKRYGLGDALHLAAAIESGCERFLTNDNRLSNFPDITVEQLP